MIPKKCGGRQSYPPARAADNGFALASVSSAAATFAALEKAAAGDAYRAVLARLRLGEVAAKKGDKDAALARFSAALDGTHRDSWLHREARARVDALFRERGDFDGLVAFHEARLSGASRDPAAAGSRARSSA